MTDPVPRQAMDQLTAWKSAGGHRRSPAEDTKRYDHADAIRIMDAWWPRLVQAQFAPGLVPKLFGILSAAATNDEPAHSGSAFQSGWYG